MTGNDLVRQLEHFLIPNRGSHGTPHFEAARSAIYRLQVYQVAFVPSLYSTCVIKLVSHLCSCNCQFEQCGLTALGACDL